MEDAGPALPGVASDMRPGEAQSLAHEFDEERSILDLPRYGTPVDFDVDLNHVAPSLYFEKNEYLGRSWLGNRGRWVRKAAVGRYVRLREKGRCRRLLPRTMRLIAFDTIAVCSFLLRRER